MQIDFVNFTPLMSLFGGLIIGLASVLMFLMFGRIAGISGILGNALLLPKKDSLWRFAFLIGIVFSGFVALPFANLSAISANDLSNKLYIILIAGFLVGVGIRIGSGCTSGHGICGISRFSTRSIFATINFLFFGIITVTVLNLLK